jgi:transcriptional regulator with XRE-family HTH domain
MDSTGKRIKKSREQKGLTQDELAVQMGKSSKQTISSWENDKNEPTLSDLKKLAQLLGTSVSYLIGEVSSVQDPGSEFITIPKDELIELQRIALGKKDQALKDKEKQIEQLKNDQ